MVVFCPTCANLLLVESGSENLRFFCKTCPYVFNVKEKITSKTLSEKKKVDDVLGGKQAWETVEKTEVVCPHCGHDSAYFMQIQMRSADEPMTTFYKCVSCMQQWREN